MNGNKDTNFDSGFDLDSRGGVRTCAFADNGATVYRTSDNLHSPTRLSGNSSNGGVETKTSARSGFRLIQWFIVALSTTGIAAVVAEATSRAFS